MSEEGARRARFDALARSTTGRLVAGLSRPLGLRHLGLAEDAVRGAFLIAWERWGSDGEPAGPEAWLARTARRHALDVLRRDRVDDALADPVDRAADPLSAPERHWIAGRLADCESGTAAYEF